MQGCTSNRNYSSPVLRVDNLNGDPWLVRLVMPGDRYGLEFCRTHGESEKNQSHRLANTPMVEFYSYKRPDLGHDFVGTSEEAIAAGAPELGQYASRYYLDTLLEVADDRRGMDLCGYIPAWKVDFVLVERVAAWVNRLLDLPPGKRPSYTEELDTYGQ